MYVYIVINSHSLKILWSLEISHWESAKAMQIMSIVRK